MKLNVTIVDDSLDDILALEQRIQKAAEELGCELVAARYTSPKSALNAIDGGRTENCIVFVDVMMPGFDGMELVPQMREKCKSNTLFVLMSSQHGFMKAGYAIEAFDFICKPFSEEDILSVMRRAVSRFKACRKGTLSFYADKTSFKVEYADIVAISVIKNYATLITPSGRYCFRTTVKELMEKLPEQFVQVSGNTVVNITRVTSISPRTVTLRKDNITLEVSKVYFDRVLEAFKNNN